MRVLSANYRSGSLLGHFRIQTSMCFYHPRKLAPLGWLIRGGYNQGNLRLSSLSLLWSTHSLEVGGGGFTDGWRIIYLLCLP